MTRDMSSKRDNQEVVYHLVELLVSQGIPVTTGNLLGLLDHQLASNTVNACLTALVLAGCLSRTGGGRGGYKYRTYPDRAMEYLWGWKTPRSTFYKRLQYFEKKRLLKPVIGGFVWDTETILKQPNAYDGLREVFGSKTEDVLERMGSDVLTISDLEEML